jgi:hypothetical protein
MHQNDLTPDYVIREYNGEDRRGEVMRAWTGEERRGIDGITLKLMAEMRAMMEKHEKMEETKINDLREDIEAHAIKSDRRHEEMIKRMDQMQQSTMNLLSTNNATVKEIHTLFEKSIPGGDAEGHRRAHEAWIRKTEKEEEFWMHLKKQVVGWGMTAAIAWAAMLIWAGFVKGPV